jgi:hypothetical protein
MNKIIRVISIGTAFLGIGLMLPLSFAQAESNMTVDWEQTPLFDQNDFMPGDSVSRYIELTNSNGLIQEIGIEAQNVSSLSADDLAFALDITIKNGSDVLYFDTLDKFYQAGVVSLGDLPDGNTAQYDIVISFLSNKESEWAGKSTGFDINIGFMGEGTDDGNEPYISLGSLGSLGGGGGSVINSGLYIFNEQIYNIGSGSAVIIWQTNLFSSSRVIYSEAGQGHTFLPENPPNYGYANSNAEDMIQVTGHSMTITGLKPNMVYYFRCFSQDSSEHAISGELSFVTGGMVAEGSDQGDNGETSRTQGRTDDNRGMVGEGGLVAGASTNAVTENTQECLGEDCQDNKTDVQWANNLLAFAGSSIKGFCLIILIIIIILLIYYCWLVVAKKGNLSDGRQGKIKKALPIVVFLLLVWYAIKCCPMCGLTCCHWFWIFLLIDAILFLTSLFLKKK